MDSVNWGQNKKKSLSVKKITAIYDLFFVLLNDVIDLCKITVYFLLLFLSNEQTVLWVTDAVQVMLPFVGYLKGKQPRVRH